ncbi:uncharacterized protein [Oryza sativa Japonica Group]|uniref:uncharacterized protein n=1 Tax=Oryza sativa subsp. japonica TaxID=39947 RepID=UPI0001C7D984|nr:uncharacterized protein LOC4329934 [Oryza sativa Japonica Group]
MILRFPLCFVLLHTKNNSIREKVSCVLPLCHAILPRDPSSFVLTVKHGSDAWFMPGFMDSSLKNTNNMQRGTYSFSGEIHLAGHHSSSLPCSTKKVDKVMEEMKPIIILSLLGGVSDDSAASYSTNWTLKQVTGETHTRVIPPQLLPKDQKIIFQKPSQHCYS